MHAANLMVDILIMLVAPLKIYVFLKTTYASTQENYGKTTQMMRMKEEHVARRMLDVAIPGKRRRGRPNLMWKDACKRDMTGGAERGRQNKRGSMEEENKLQMMG